MSRSNEPGTGWFPKRDNQRWAMGRPVVLKGLGNTTAKLTVTGCLPGDFISGIANLSDPSEAQANLSNAVPGTDEIEMSTGTPFTIGEHYVVFLYRRQEDDRG